MRSDRVYLVGPSRSGPIKIGNTTGSMKHRIQNLQAGYPGKLHCYGEYNGSPGWRVELRVHELLKDRKIYGDWFRVTAEEAAAAVIEAGAMMLPDDLPMPPKASAAEKKRSETARKLEIVRKLGWSSTSPDRLSVQEIARQSELSTKTIYRAVEERQLPHRPRIKRAK